jgi:hypothetical protein
MAKLEYSMSGQESLEVSKIRNSLEALWASLDTLFEEMSPADWGLPHGPDWVFADVPYHLAYIDRLMVVQPIELGESLAPVDQVRLRSFNDLNAWNQANFAARPAGQTVQTSLEQMHSSRDRIRRITAEMTDVDLSRSAWFPALNMRGWRSAEIALNFCLGHTWQHMEEARVRHGHAGTMVGPDLTHALLAGDAFGIPGYLKVPTTTLFLDSEQAHELDFSLALDITGPGGGIWSFRASEDGWLVEEVESAGTDLVLTQDLDTYIKFRYSISDLESLVEASRIEVNDEKALSLYQQIKVEPDLDFVFPQLP